MAGFARQVDFDAVVKDLIESNGLSIDEAATEAAEIFSGDYDTSGLFIYRDATEFAEKQKMETRLKTIDAASRGTETFVNANFALQGINQLLGKGVDNNITRGSWKLVETRNLIQSLVRLLVVKEEDEAGAGAGEDEEDDEEDDADEERTLQTIAVLEAAVFIAGMALRSPALFRNPTQMLTCDEEMMTTLYARLDEDSGEARSVSTEVIGLKLK